MSPPEQKWYFPPEIAGSLISENPIQYQSSCLRSLRINLRTVTQIFQVSELGLRAETNPVHNQTDTISKTFRSQT